MVWSPLVRRIVREGDGADSYVVGHRLVDEFLDFAAGRARPNTVRAYAHDLKAFFAIVAKEPTDVRAADVFGSSTRNGALVWARRTWSGSPMAARGCRTPPSGGGSRRCRRSTAI